MGNSIIQLIALYSIFYIAIPVLIGLMILKIKQIKDFIGAFTRFNEDPSVKSSAILRKDKKKLKNFQVLLVILILISMPALNLTYYSAKDISMRRTRDYSGRGYFPAHYDRVDDKIGPSFDVEKLIKQMEEEKYKNWYLDDIRDQIDLDDIFRFPGRLTVYRLKSTLVSFEQIVINYDYLSPLPITRSIIFTIVKGEAFLDADNIVVYPMPPSLATPS